MLLLLARAKRLPDVRKLNRELLRAARAGDTAAVNRAIQLGAEVNAARVVVKGNKLSETMRKKADKAAHPNPNLKP